MHAFAVRGVLLRIADTLFGTLQESNDLPRLLDAPHSCWSLPLATPAPALVLRDPRLRAAARGLPLPVRDCRGLACGHRTKGGP